MLKTKLEELSTKDGDEQSSDSVDEVDAKELETLHLKGFIGCFGRH